MKKIILSFLTVMMSVALCSQTLQASYNFSGGTGADNSGNNNNGTVFGTSTTSNTLVIGANVTDYFVIPASTLNNRLAFGVSFKIHFMGFNTANNISTNQIIAGDNSFSEGAFALSYQKSLNMWRFAFNGQLFDFPDNSINTGQWYCVALTRNGNGDLTFYVNGIANSAIYNDNGLVNITGLLLGQETDCFGSCFDVNQCANAMIDDFSLYSNVQSPSSITAACTVCNIPPDPINVTAVSNQTMCSNTQNTLSAIGSGTLQWFATPNPVNMLASGNSFVLQNLNPGNHTFYVSALTCARSQNMVPAQVNVMPAPVLAINAGSICAGQNFAINPSGAVTYSISGGTFIVSPPVNTTYTVTGSHSSGCTNTAVITVTVNAVPVLTITGNTTVCRGEDIRLVVYGASTYTWNNGSNSSVMPDQGVNNTSYSVTGTNASGCTANASVNVIVDPCTGITQNREGVDGLITFYPNPFAEHLIVSSNKNCRFELYDQLGKIQSAGNFTEGINQPDFNQLVPGLYVIRVISEKHSASYKLVKTAQQR